MGCEGRVGRCNALLLAIRSLLCWSLAALLFACQPAQPPVQSRPDERASSDNLPEARYQVAQPTLEQQDERGNTLWKLQAQALQGRSGGKQAEGTLIEVQGWLYRNGKPVLKLTARYARADAERREVEAWGKVQAISRVNRARLQADRVLWKARDDRLIATGGVVIQWGDFTMRDEHLTLDTALERAWGGN
ncbi:MAG: LPS export ABC transporter periplasmic protein LptC [Armatimonadota bacterium]